MTVIHRLNRGLFSGQVVRHDDGPYQGWFSYWWTAGGESGGTSAIGKAGAIAGLHAAYLDFCNRHHFTHSNSQRGY